MPNGERVTCCDRCAPHARAAAADAAGPYTHTRATDRESALDQRRGACDGCRGTFLESELEDLVLEDGTIISCCPSCAAQAPGRGGGTDGTIGAEADDSSTAGPSDGADESSGADGGTQNRCSQCTDVVVHALFRVTTVDGRTERLCRSCKEAAEEEGIITDIEMRAARAREVLGVDADATADDIRSAYHQQVKRAHPDRTSGSRSAFRLVTDAYERLQRDLEES